MMKLIIFFLHIFQLFLDDTKVKNFITCFKGTCTSQFVSIKLVHVADVTYPWLTTCAKQYRDPCFGSQMDSVNYQQCFSNFPFNLITVADPGEGSPCLIFGPNWGPNGRKNSFGRQAHPTYLRVGMTGPPAYLNVWIWHWISQLNHGFFYQVNCCADSNPGTWLGPRTRIAAPAHRWT